MYLKVNIQIEISTGSLRTWGEVAEGAGNDGGDVALVGLHERGEAEVRHPGLHVVVEEYVAGLDVAVDDVRYAVVVEVGQPPRHAQRDLVPHRPVQEGLLLLLLAVEDGVQAAVGHELVDEQVEVRRRVVAAERDDVPVLDVAHGVQLPLEPAVHLRAPPAQLLDGERRLLVQPQQGHRPVPTGADDVLARQPP